MTGRSLYLLAAYVVIDVVVQAQQPDGYLGCFNDSQGDSLINRVVGYSNTNLNTGERCKTACKTKAKRFAGAKKQACYCGDGVKNNTSMATCNTPCPVNKNELCGNSTTIIIYDTWKSVTSTKMPSTHLSTSTSSPVTGLTTTTISTTQLTTEATSALTTTLTSTKSFTISITTSKITVTNASVTANYSMFSDIPNAQTSTTPLAVYISVPLTVVIAVAAVITVLMIRKTRTQKKDDTTVIYKKSDKESHPFSAVENNAYNDQDIIRSDTPVYVNRTARNKANPENVGTDEESTYQYETTDNYSQSSGTNNQIPVDEYGYGHLKSMTTAVCDPTYSHTPNLKCDYNHDYTYSHTEKTTKSAENLKAVNDTYSHIDKSAGKLNAGETVIATDDTYSKLNNHGTKVNLPDKHTELVLNEPDYDHTDIGKPS